MTTTDTGPWRLGPPPAEPVAERGLFGLGRLRRRGVRSRRAAYRIATLRRVLAALLAGVVVFVIARAVAPPAPMGLVDVVVTRRELPAGAVLDADDVEVAARDPTQVPNEALTDRAAVLGQSLGSPVAAGEVLTTLRLRGSSLLAGQASDVVAVALPLADATMARAVRPGDEVTVHAVGTGVPLARGIVLSVEAADTSALTGQAGPVGVVIGVSETEASALAGGMGGPSAGFLLALHG